MENNWQDYVRKHHREKTVLEMCRVLGNESKSVYNFMNKNGLTPIRKGWNFAAVKWEMKGEYFNCDGYCPITGFKITEK